MSSIYKIKAGRDIRTRLAFLKLRPGATVAVYDLETTGLDPIEDRILQFAAKKYLVKDDGSWEQVGKPYNLYINPEMPIPEEAAKVNHITDELVADEPTISERRPEIQEIMNVDFWCGHNITGFDNYFMMHQVYDGSPESMPSGAKNSIDTLPGAIDLVPHKDCYQYRLGALSKFFGIEADSEGTGGYHDAAFDIQQTAELAQILVKIYNEVEPEPEKGYVNPRIKPVIYSIRPWKADKKAYVYGNYYFVNTDCGKFAYNRYEQVWTRKEVYKPVSIQAVIEAIYEKLGIQSDNELLYLEKKYPDGVRFTR